MNMSDKQIDFLKRLNELLIKKYSITPSFFEKEQVDYINSLSEKDICNFLSINPIILNLITNQTDLMHSHILNSTSDVKILDKINFQNLTEDKLISLSKKSIKITRKLIKSHDNEKFHFFAIERLKKYPNEYCFFHNPSKKIKYKLIESYLPSFFVYYKHIVNKDFLSKIELEELREMENYFTQFIISKDKPTAFGIYWNFSLLNHFDIQNIILIYIHFLNLKKIEAKFNHAEKHIISNVIALLKTQFNLDDATIALNMIQ